MSDGPVPSATDPLAGLDLDAAAASPGSWLELSIAADHEAVESVSEILSRAAPGGTSVEPAFELVDEGLAARWTSRDRRSCAPTSRCSTSRPCAPRWPERSVTSATSRPSGCGRSATSRHASCRRPIGRTRGRTHFPVLRVGRRIVIRPTWRRHHREPGDVVIALDPGMAFGTGLHPTTRLCLAALESMADRSVLATETAAARVLDVGSGSGILSIAAVRLGAGRVLALDIDPIAVEATSANAKRNGLARRIRAREGSSPSGEGPFDVVVGNLIASVLIALADGLVEDLRPGGTLLASGIFENREAEVAAAFAARGLTIEHRWTEGDWVALELRLPA